MRRKSRSVAGRGRLRSRSVRSPGVAVFPTFKLGPVDPLGLHVLRQVEDRRRWHPAGFLRPPGAFVRSAARQVVKSKSNALRNDISSRIGFAVPKKVLVCVRRKQRKEVLHALGKAGGRGITRRRRRNDWSNVDCT